MPSEELRFRHEGATVKVVVWDDKRATLSNLFSLKRGRGHANAVMQQVCDYADRHDLHIVLDVGRYGYSDNLSPDNAGLRRFYRKFGFETVAGNMMQRCPSQELHAS